MNRPAHLTAAEQNLRAQFGTCPDLAKFARLARERAETANANIDLSVHSAEAFEVGATIVGPILGSFTAWVLNQAIEDGIDRLYFLARDGQTPLYIAQEFQKAGLLDQVAVPLKLHYLYASRASWRVMLFEPQDPAYRRKVEFSAVRTVRGFLAVIGLPAEDINQLLTGLAGEAPLDPDATLNRITSRQFWQLAGTTWRPLIVESLRSRQAFFQRYLKSERVLDPGRIGIVDLGWNGSLQHCLELAVGAAQHPQPQITGYYFGLNSLSCERMRHFAFGPTDRSHWLRYDVSLIEALASADHASVLGFEQPEHGATVRPIFQPETQVAPLPVIAMQRGAIAYAGAVATGGANLSQLATSRPERLIRRLISRPTTKEAQVIGALPFSTFVGDRESGPLARPCSLSSAIVWSVSPRRATDQLPWPAGSFALNPATSCCGPLLVRTKRIILRARDFLLSLTKR